MQAFVPERLIGSLAGGPEVHGGDVAAGRDSPDSVPHVVRYKQRTTRIQRNADGSSYRVALLRQKSGQEIFGESSGLAVLKRHEHHLVSRAWFAIP
jgi:hypothetical protein